MSSRHQPANGADSPQVVLNAYLVLVEEEAGGRIWVDIPSAFGPNDAKHQAVEKMVDRGYRDVTAIKAELHPDYVPQAATFDELLAWAGSHD